VPHSWPNSLPNQIQPPAGVCRFSGHLPTSSIVQNHTIPKPHHPMHLSPSSNQTQFEPAKFIFFTQKKYNKFQNLLPKKILFPVPNLKSSPPRTQKSQRGNYYPGIPSAPSAISSEAGGDSPLHPFSRDAQRSAPSNPKSKIRNPKFRHTIAPARPQHIFILQSPHASPHHRRPNP
jgi:hypothetical protein